MNDYIPTIKNLLIHIQNLLIITIHLAIFFVIVFAYAYGCIVAYKDLKRILVKYNRYNRGLRIAIIILSLGSFVSIMFAAIISKALED